MAEADRDFHRCLCRCRRGVGVKDAGVLVVVLGPGRLFHLLFLMNFQGLDFALLGVMIESVLR